MIEQLLFVLLGVAVILLITVLALTVLTFIKDWREF